MSDDWYNVDIEKYRYLKKLLKNIFLENVLKRFLNNGIRFYGKN